MRNALNDMPVDFTSGGGASHSPQGPGPLDPTWSLVHQHRDPNREDQLRRLEKQLGIIRPIGTSEDRWKVVNELLATRGK